MTDSNKTEETIFDIARRIGDPEARKEYVTQATGDDVALKERVLELLELSQRDSLFDRPPVGISSQDVSQSENVGSNIGPYRIREKIGEGGMGVVYVADQTKPVQRQVAVKIIKPGMDTKEVIARFEAERQALAFMEHPNIARVLDAGATESGRSYFVMELVRGIPITEYCDQVRATPSERLELFQTVCDAVQHAHQKGIIHRDIKPSNVLVTQVSAKPIVKVIDFGLAKATSGQKLTDKTVYTGFLKLMGTPVYMSPEQAGLSGLDVDTRSDVYSLGILLYELLTGTTPLDKTKIQKQAYEELCRQVREIDAPKPSSRISTLKDAECSTIAQQRQIEPTSLRQLLSGDLDLVVLKALEKDRERRYGTPQDLAADIGRFLKDQPVQAVPPSPFYVAKKYVRRHQAAILTAAVFLTFLVATSVISTWLAIRANKAEAVASADREIARRAEKKAAAAAEQRTHELYVNNLLLADQIWNSPKGTLRQVEELLAEWIPVKGQEDLREFSWRYQWNRLHPKLVFTLDSTVSSTIGKDGCLIAANDVGIRKYDASKKLIAHYWTGDASSAVLSADGRWAALPSTSTIKLIELSSIPASNLAAAEDVQKTSMYDLPGARCTFSSDSRLLACWSAEAESEKANEIHIWELTDGTPQKTRSIQLRAVDVPPNQGAFALAPDGESYLLKGVARLKHAPKIDVLAVLKGRDEPVVCETQGTPPGACIWSATGDWFAVGNLTGKVNLYRKSSASNIVLASHGKQITSIAISLDETKLVSGGSDGTIDVWELAAQPIRIRTLKAHVEPIRSISLSPDALELVSTDESGITKRWHVEQLLDRAIDLKALAPQHFRANVGINHGGEDPTIVDSVEPGASAADSGRVSQGDRLIAISDATGTMQSVADKFYDELFELLRFGEPGAKVRIELQRVSDGGREVIELERRSNNEKLSRTLRVEFARDDMSLAVANQHGGFIWKLGETSARRMPALSCSVAHSPDGRLLAMSDHTQVILWDLKADRRLATLATGQRLRPKETGGTSNSSLAFSPDGKYLAAGTGFPFNHRPKQSDLVVWDVTQLNEAKQDVPGRCLLVNDHVLTALNFTPNGRMLIAVEVLRMWDTSTWSLKRTVKVRRRATAMNISPDGNTLAIGFGRHLSNESGIILWDLANMFQRRTLRTYRPLAIAFSADGNTLVSTSSKQNVTLFDLRVGRQILTLNGHESIVAGAAFSSDGTKLATTDIDGGLRLWEGPTLTEIDENPTTLKALLRRGRIENQEGRHVEAKATLEHALRLQQKWLPKNAIDISMTREQLDFAIEGLALKTAEPEHPPP